jgi:hypothetical protein
VSFFRFQKSGPAGKFSINTRLNLISLFLFRHKYYEGAIRRKCGGNVKRKGFKAGIGERIPIGKASIAANCYGSPIKALGDDRRYMDPR